MAVVLALAARGVAARAAAAQAVADPADIRYVDATGNVALMLPGPAGGRKPSLAVRAHRGRLAGRPARFPAKTYAWDKVGRVAAPSRALISEPAEAVLLLGTRGETGVGLGQLEVRAFDGRVLGDIDLREKIPDLAARSADWAKSGGAGGPFPWIVSARLLPDGIVARVAVCGGREAVVNLRSLSVTVAKP